MLNRVWTAIRVSVILIAVVSILIPLLIGITVFLWIVDVPRKVGQYLTLEEAIRRLAFRIFDPHEMRAFRDDMLHIIESEIDEGEKWDRWGLLRDIDTAQDEIEDRLKDGEFAFTFGGGIAALIVGNVFGLTYGGIVLTIVGLLFSFVVALRIIITDALCYQSINHQDDSLRHLAILKGWNRGPVFGKGAMSIAILSMIASRGGAGYRLGTELLELFAEWKIRGEEKWRVD